MNAWRSGVVIAKIRHQTVMSASATTKLVVRPMSAISTTVSTPPRMSASVRRLKSRRILATVRPPRICAPATIAAARPAMP